MSSDQVAIERTVSTVKGLTDQIVDLSGGRIDQINEALDHHIATFEQITELRVSRVEGALMGPVVVIYQNAVFHTLRGHWHASPSLIVILAAIWTVIKAIWDIVKFIMQIVEIIQALNLDDMLASVWPEFNAARERFRAWVGDLSEAIGWGVDGLLHLLHATQTFTDVYGGLTGKSYTWMEAEWMVKTGNVLEQVKFYSREITENPGRVLELIFQSELGLNWKLTSKFGEKLTTDVMLALGKGKAALDGLGSIADDLTAIQENMPEVIRQNIPTAIWTSLEGFSNTINTQILPRVRWLEDNLSMVNNVFADHSNKISNLADKLAHPGTNLLGIDDLPDYARAAEEWAVDDVASRLFNSSVNSERAAMQPDLDAFALIDAAAAATLQPLPFMDIETPSRGALHGIVAEPQETWFVGGYSTTL